jgi:hypothetical protein
MSLALPASVEGVVCMPMSRSTWEPRSGTSSRKAQGATARLDLGHGLASTPPSATTVCSIEPAAPPLAEGAGAAALP